MDADEEEITNLRLLERWNIIQKNEIRCREYFLEDAEYVVIGYGTAGRVAFSAVRAARAEGIHVGLLRPITVSPFPVQKINSLASRASAFLVVEMNTGQMLNDVQRAVNGQVPVEFYGRLGGVVPYPEEILDEIRRLANSSLTIVGDPRLSWINRLKESLN
jgi:2-oxoglutarate ferredoxin oxidoreductase subunit alpha